MSAIVELHHDAAQSRSSTMISLAEPRRAQMRDHADRALLVLVSDDATHQDQIREPLRSHVAAG